MNTDIKEVETILADVGRRCNPQLVEKKHAHARQMKSDAAEHSMIFLVSMIFGVGIQSLIRRADASKHAFGAQLSLLHRCTLSISRLLRKRASLLLVAKLSIVSRQLQNTLSQHASPPPFLDDLRSQLAHLNQTLLKRINKRLASTNTTDDSIIESLAAYCLATRCSSDDAIHQFHQVRLDVITSQLDKSRVNIPKALSLFVRTLQTSKTLRSRQFSDVLSKLKSTPILSDPDIRSLDGLELEILGRWAVPEVKNFTPWIKLSELSRTAGVDSIKEWSSQAFDKFTEGCDKCLADSNEFNDLLALRAETLELWLSSWGSTITYNSNDVLERLRTIFNNHTKRVLSSQIQSIDEVGAQILSTISEWDSAEHVPAGSLWDSDLISADFSDGAASFKHIVADRLLGRDHDVSAVLKKYQTWLSFIGEKNESIESLRQLRWTDILVGGEVEDEDIDITPSLNQEDPKILFDTLHSAVKQALEKLEKSLNNAFNALGTAKQSAKARYLLRLVRLVRRDIPAEFVASDFLFSRSMVPQLQNLLASDIMEQAAALPFVSSLKTDSASKALKAVPGRTLWEGELAIPVQPSPSTFKTLRHLSATMDETGTDLWDPSTVDVLKAQLQLKIETVIKSTLDEMVAWDGSSKATKSPPASDEKTEDGRKDESEDKADSPKDADKKSDNEHASQVDILRDWQMQLLFDATYLAAMLGDSSTQLASVTEAIQKSLESRSDAFKGIQQGAAEYWKRTELLFGLLASR